MPLGAKDLCGDANLQSGWGNARDVLTKQFVDCCGLLIWDQRWPVCSPSTRMRSSGWRTGLCVDSAQQIIAEVGSTAATFPSREVSLLLGGRLPRRRRECRRELQPSLSEGQPPHAARSQPDRQCRSQNQRKHLRDRVSPLSPALGHNQAIGAIAHRQCRLIWLILHQGVRYEERGPAVTKQTKQRHTARMIRELRALGYRIETPNPQASHAQAQ
jgi:hypothetical protein